MQIRDSVWSSASILILVAGAVVMAESARSQSTQSVGQQTLIGQPVTPGTATQTPVSATVDADYDSLSAWREHRLGTDDSNADTDGDGEGDFAGSRGRNGSPRSWEFQRFGRFGSALGFLRERGSRSTRAPWRPGRDAGDGLHRGEPLDAFRSGHRGRPAREPF